ncbi:MAG: hypothetical protein ACXVIR_12090 [Halobacteriota archaeon]
MLTLIKGGNFGRYAPPAIIVLNSFTSFVAVIVAIIEVTGKGVGGAGGLGAVGTVVVWAKGKTRRAHLSFSRLRDCDRISS